MSSWPKNNHFPTAIGQCSKISFSDKQFSKIFKNKICFLHIDTVDLGRARQSSAEHGEARWSLTELEGSQRSYVELDEARWSWRIPADLSEYQRSTAALCRA